MIRDDGSDACPNCRDESDEHHPCSVCGTARATPQTPADHHECPSCDLTNVEIPPGKLLKSTPIKRPQTPAAAWSWCATCGNTKPAQTPVVDPGVAREIAHKALGSACWDRVGHSPECDRLTMALCDECRFDTAHQNHEPRPRASTGTPKRECMAYCSVVGGCFVCGRASTGRAVRPAAEVAHEWFGHECGWINGAVKHSPACSRAADALEADRAAHLETPGADEAKEKQ